MRARLKYRPTTIPILAALVCLPGAAARNKVDAARLGGETFSTLQLLRTDSGPNAVSVGLGTPPQLMNLTATTNEWYLSVAGDCMECTPGYNGFNASASSTYTESNQHLVYEFNFPTEPDDTLEVSAVYARDALTLVPDNKPDIMPFTNLYAVREGMTRRALCPGTHGFFGLAVDPSQPHKSLVPATMDVLNAQDFTFGIDMDPWKRMPPPRAGEIHWGGVPAWAYVSDFNWMEADAAAGWATSIDSVRINDIQIELPGYHATFDPSFDEIYMPLDVADRIFRAINAQRIGKELRWFLGCNANMSMSITIAGVQYALDPGVLVTSRWSRGVCSSNIVAWQNASHPGVDKEIRLGSAFLSGVYAAFHYANGTQYVGLAGKPGGVNNQNLNPHPLGKSNKVAIAAALGTLIPLLFIVLALCYFCNRRSAQATWARRYRRAARDEYNRSMRGGSVPASVRGDTKGTEKDHLEGTTVPILTSVCTRDAKQLQQTGTPRTMSSIVPLPPPVTAGMYTTPLPGVGHGYAPVPVPADRNAPLPPTPHPEMLHYPAAPLRSSATRSAPPVAPLPVPVPTPRSPQIIPTSPDVHNHDRSNRKLRNLFGGPFRRPPRDPHPATLDPEGWARAQNEVLSAGAAERAAREQAERAQAGPAGAHAQQGSGQGMGDLLGLYESASEVERTPPAFSLEEYRRHQTHHAFVAGCAFCHSHAQQPQPQAMPGLHAPQARHAFVKPDWAGSNFGEQNPPPGVRIRDFATTPGAKGATGATGATGAIGATGATGATGVAEAAGAMAAYVPPVPPPGTSRDADRLAHGREKEEAQHELARAHSLKHGEEHIAAREAEPGASERLARAKLARALAERERAERAEREKKSASRSKGAREAREHANANARRRDEEMMALQRERERLALAAVHKAAAADKAAAAAAADKIRKEVRSAKEQREKRDEKEQRKHKEEQRKQLKRQQQDRGQREQEQREQQERERREREQREQARAQAYHESRAREAEKYRDMRDNERAAHSRARGADADLDVEKERAKDALWEREQERQRAYLFERERQRERELLARLARERDAAGADLDTSTEGDSEDRAREEWARRERDARRGFEGPRDTRRYDVRSAFDPKWTSQA